MFPKPSMGILRKAIVPSVRVHVAGLTPASTCARTLRTTAIQYSSSNTKPAPYPIPANLKTFNEIKTEEDLIPPGVAPGEVPTDYNQATGLERLEILGKVDGVDVFDMRPLEASRLGTMDDPIVVRSFGKERYLGCTGFPADSHVVIWLTVSKDRPIERCPECGSVYKMDYVGAEEEHHDGHDHHGYVEPLTMADFVKPEYR